MGKFVLLSVLVLITIVESVTAQSFLDRFLWKNRVVLVVDHNVAHPKQMVQFMAFYKKKAENKDRDLVLLGLTKNQTFLGFEVLSVPPEDLLKQLRLGPAFQGMLLLGKDGGIKLKSTSFTNPEDVYTLIDGMPMRKQEVKLKKKQ